MSRLVRSWWMAGAIAMGLLLWGQPVSSQGPEWVRQNPPPTGNDLNGVWGRSDSDVYAVGTRGTILHYDGSSWSSMKSDVSEHLYGVWGSSDSDVYAVGDRGTILHYDGSTWSAMDMNAGSLNGVWGSSGGDVFAVGYAGTILHYDGSAWSSMSSDNGLTLQGVWGSSGADPGPRDVYAVGWELYDDAIPRHDGSTWSSMDRGTGHYARGIILYYDGSTWSSMDSGTNYWLREVWGSSNRNVFAVGWNGTILHFDGRRWSVMSSGVTDDLIGIWGIPDSGVFAVGMGGAILHHTLVPRLTIRKDAAPVGLVPYRGAITYTVVLGNSGTGSATGTMLTDALPAEVDFARWLERPGDARVESDEITWGGKVEAGEAITLSFVVDHVGNYGDVVTNTAVYSHASGGGSDDATFKVEPAPILLPLIVNAFSP